MYSRDGDSQRAGKSIGQKFWQKWQIIFVFKSSTTPNDSEGVGSEVALHGDFVKDVVSLLGLACSDKESEWIAGLFCGQFRFDARGNEGFSKKANLFCRVSV